MNGEENEKPVLRPFERHILVCTGPRCAPDQSARVYDYLKQRLKELGRHDGPNRIQRSQCHCFGICKGGPLAVVYPDDIWYHHVDEQKMETILQSHLLAGQPVQKDIFYCRPPGVS